MKADIVIVGGGPAGLAAAIAAAKEAGLRVDMQITPELRSVPALIEDFIKRHDKSEIKK